jgi:Ca2+-binding EF-hand superfamily protein
MSNHNSSIGLSLAAATLGLSGSALAVAVSPGTTAFNTADADHSGLLSWQEFVSTLPIKTTYGKADLKFKKADRDASAGITLPEYLVYVGEEAPPTKEELSFAAADEDDNGFIDSEEFAASFSAPLAPIQIRLRFIKTDADESNHISPEEWTLFKKGKAKGEEGVKYTKFDLADLNNDDELTIDEFALTFAPSTKEATIAAKFAKEDADDSGFLTRDEWNPGAPKESAPL